MDVGSVNNSNLRDSIAIEVQKMGMDAKEKLVSKFLEDNLSPEKISQQVAQTTGAGGNLNIIA